MHCIKKQNALQALALSLGPTFPHIDDHLLAELAPENQDVPDINSRNEKSNKR